MYDIRPNLIIGFHGCEASIRDALITNPDKIKISKKPYDWLGHGMYFWENNYERALQWAQEKKKRSAIKDPAVVGAVLHLGYCCDFLDSKYILMLAGFHDLISREYKTLNKALPQNRDLPYDQHKDRILRELDCTIIEFMHTKLLRWANADIKEKGFSDHKIFDSTRGMFTEGGPAFEGAGIFAKSHIQVCVRNLNCIKGFFLPRKEINFVEWLDADME
jgi:hypothetical protein